MPTKIVLCTLALNEMEHLPKLYSQHKDWEGMVKWIFVESADIVYAQTNPELVNDKGLSVDGTSEFLADLAKSDDRVVYIPYGFSQHSNPAQGKCDSRQQYLNVIQEMEEAPDFFFVLDADEYYISKHQSNITRIMTGERRFDSFCFKHRHPWYPPSYQGRPLFEYEVTGGFWDIPLCRGWKWYPQLRYSQNHNTPEMRNGILLDKKMLRCDKKKNFPECVHMAFSSSVKIRHAKNAYYAARGEGKVDHRGWYVESRAAFETWKDGNTLPNGAKISKYDGPIPECFK